MIHLLKVTAFNLPRVTRACGASLALLIAVAHLAALTRSEAPNYLDYLFVTAAAGAVIAAGGILQGFRVTGWGVGVTISTLTMAAYALSRSLGLPGFDEAVGAWHDPVGTVSLTLEILFVALALSIALGWNVDSPGQRDWDTYFSHPRQ